MNIQELIIKNLTEGLCNKFDDVFLEALSKKGFEFKNRKETEEFIKENVTCIDNLQEKQKVFYVNGVPFLLHEYKSVLSEVVIINNCPTIKGEYGSYAYL